MEWAKQVEMSKQLPGVATDIPEQIAIIHRRSPAAWGKLCTVYFLETKLKPSLRLTRRTQRKDLAYFLTQLAQAMRAKYATNATT